MTWTYRPKRDDLIIPNIYLYWGIPHHAPSGTEWRASSGMRVFGNPRYGLPHKTSRAILIYLATMGTDRHKRFEGSLAEINEMFDADWSMASLEKHFLIVTHSEFECTETACACPRVCSGRQRVVYDVRYRPENHTFRVTISDELHRSAGRGIECPREHIQAFVRQNALASLDLYFSHQGARLVLRGLPDVRGTHGVHQVRAGQIAQAGRDASGAQGRRADVPGVALPPGSERPHRIRPGPTAGTA